MPSAFISQSVVGEERPSSTENEKEFIANRPSRPTFSREHQSEAGKALVAKRGRSYMAEIGRKGYAVTKARYPDFHIRGGQASWRKQNRLMLEAGYFPNQSHAWWNYCQTPGCHNSKVEGNLYCAKHIPQSN